MINHIIDYSPERWFVLINTKHNSEFEISVEEVAKYETGWDTNCVKFTKIAKDELEEIQYNEAIAHYLGEDKTHPQANAEANKSI